MVWTAKHATEYMMKIMWISSPEILCDHISVD